jgi:hypothetical protein
MNCYVLVLDNPESQGQKADKKTKELVPTLVLGILVLIYFIVKAYNRRK